MKDWLLAFLSCQECGAELAVDTAEERQNTELITGSLACSACQLRFPVLAGIPFLLPDPGAHLASHRECILAALVEEGQASRAALALVNEFSEGHQCEAERYADDWTAHESGAPLPAMPEGTAALAHHKLLVEEEGKSGLHPTVLAMLEKSGPRADTIIEVGPGAGSLSALLARRTDKLVLVDLSLRSLLCARHSAASEPAQVAALLGDASALELASDMASLVVAANLVDLLDEPEHFLLAASRWLKPKGELILTTPEPSLGGASDDILRSLLESLEFEIAEIAEGIPWIRKHSARYSQLYWLQALRATILG